MLKRTMEDYDVMVREARPFVETVIREAQDVHASVVKKVEASWEELDQELSKVEEGVHPVLQAMRAAHDKASLHAATWRVGRH